MKKTIICIVGESCAGKTALTLDLQNTYNIPCICSYTTRPMRPGETNGIEHRFISENEVPDKSEMSAYTEFGGYQYWTTFAQLDENIMSTYVVDEKGILYFREVLSKSEYYQENFDIKTVKVIRDNKEGIDEERMERDKERVVIPDDEYDLIINNDGTIHDMSVKLINCIYENRWIPNYTSVYISIPITGLDSMTQRHKADSMSFDNFDRYFMMNPFNAPDPDPEIINDMSEKDLYAYYMGESIKMMLSCDAVYFMEGWENSKGCRAEWELATIYGLIKIIVPNN